jgi:hypothetical protein
MNPFASAAAAMSTINVSLLKTSAANISTSAKVRAQDGKFSLNAVASRLQDTTCQALRLKNPEGYSYKALQP